MVARSRRGRRSQAVPDLRRKGPGRAAHPRPERRRSLSRPVPGAGLSRFRQHSEPGRQHAAVCRGPLHPRPAKPGAQPGDRMETLRAGRRGAGRGAASSPTRMPAAPARSPPRSRNSATRRAAAPAAAWTSCGRWSRRRCAPITTGRTRSSGGEEIVTAYLNSTPLASMPGYGEIIGLPDALWVWFGTDLASRRRS